MADTGGYLKFFLIFFDNIIKRREYSHSLLRSMACWRGESSTSAFGGDWLPSAIFDSDPGTALAAFLPAASAAALSCCGEGFAPFLPFPVSLQARRTDRNEQNVAVLWINLSYVGSKRTDRACRVYRPKLECQSDPGSFGMFLSRMTEWRINRHSIVRRFHQKTKSERATKQLLFPSLRGESSPDKKRQTSTVQTFTPIVYTSSTCILASLLDLANKQKHLEIIVENFHESVSF